MTLVKKLTLIGFILWAGFYAVGLCFMKDMSDIFALTTFFLLIFLYFFEAWFFHHSLSCRIDENKKRKKRNVIIENILIDFIFPLGLTIFLILLLTRK